MDTRKRVLLIHPPAASALLATSLKNEASGGQRVFFVKTQSIILRAILCLGFVLIALSNSAALAGENPAAGEPAIKMYDSVAYFTAGKSVKGSASFTFSWHNMVWYFTSKENRDLFAQAPEKYAPQYDGYCAWAMSEGRKAITDPQVWRIVDGKLYLNCSRSAYEKWIRDIPGNIAKADVNWRKINGAD